MRRIMVAAVAVPLVLAGSTGTAHADTPSTAQAVFSHHLIGESTFAQSGTSITVTGLYSGLMPNRAYFTVVYGNGNCDPAQAFPVGPFWTNALGIATLGTTVTAPAGLVGATMSMSVRRGDNATDIDHDGKKGPTDVVAVAGKPRIGLIECDGHPTVG